MSTLRSQDRVSLCSFTFADGRRCRTPRQSGHPRFCCFHARKEAQAQTAEDLGRDISYFFSGRYLSACDLSAALGRLFAATAQGHIKPRTAATLAYLAQTLVQCIQLSQKEYTNAFGPDDWRQSVRSSVNSNSDYLSQDPAQDAEQTTNQDQQPVAAPQPAAPTAPCSTGFTPALSSPPPVAQTSPTRSSTAPPLPAHPSVNPHGINTYKGNNIPD